MPKWQDALRNSASKETVKASNLRRIPHLTDCPHWDRAVFLGRDQGEVLRAEDLAGWAQTISYEIYCALGNANLKRYTGV
jgi:hypothetical protein